MKEKYDENLVFPVSESVGERPWGTEDILALVQNKFSVKRLKINAGSKGGLQYHRLKDEVAIMVVGSMLIRYDLGDGILREKIVGAGDVIHFPPGLIHQEEALTQCEIIEASTPHFNDRVRMEEEYGLGKPVGLQSTSVNEIETR
jgi:mannose-6-phosphate isomerase-like protein (cupin superfamily)